MTINNAPTGIIKNPISTGVSKNPTISKITPIKLVRLTGIKYLIKFILTRIIDHFISSCNSSCIRITINIY
jgi:hypothetical protein